jgi:hypothetical protein
MSVVNATLCIPFTPIEQTIALLSETVSDACKRTCFPHEEEALATLAELEDILIPLLYAKLIESINVDFGLATLRISFAYDADPEQEDEVDIDLLDLVLAPPDLCVITLTLNDSKKAAFLRCLELSQYARPHVSVELLSPPEDTEEGEYPYSDICI